MALSWRQIWCSLIFESFQQDPFRNSPHSAVFSIVSGVNADYRDETWTPWTNTEFLSASCRNDFAATTQIYERHSLPVTNPDAWERGAICSANVKTAPNFPSKSV
jgi:hypothetical protein